MRGQAIRVYYDAYGFGSLLVAVQLNIILSPGLVQKLTNLSTILIGPPSLIISCFLYQWKGKTMDYGSADDNIMSCQGTSHVV